MAVQSYVELARQQADRVVTPDTRQKAYDAVYAFAQERPILTSFLAFQTLFSLLPLALFASFVLGTAALALVTAALFTLFWTGVAALVLGTTLFVTSGLAVLAWGWVVGVYLVGGVVYGFVVGGGSGIEGAGGDGKPGNAKRRKGTKKWEELRKAGAIKIWDGAGVPLEDRVDGGGEEGDVGLGARDEQQRMLDEKWREVVAVKTEPGVARVNGGEEGRGAGEGEL